MARLGKREQERRRREFILASVAIAVVLCVAAGAGYFLYARQDGIDQMLCPAGGPLGHYVLLVDKTDPLNFTQKAALEVTLNELIEEQLPEGYLLSVFVLGEDFKVTAAPLVELCNPGTGADKSKWTSNQRKLKRQYEKQFVEPLRKQTQALVASTPAKASPIFEMMQLVGINGFRKHHTDGDRRLIIVSDMLHHTQNYSMYSGAIDYSAFSSSDYGRKAQADLQGITVEIHYLMNTPKLQTKRNLKFWEDYFEAAGARITAVHPLEG